MEIDFISILIQLVDKYPAISSVIFVIGTLRVINKPLFSLARAVVGVTPSKKDDEYLDKVEQSKVYKTVLYLFDWFASVKIK
jgi:hypothetical protein